ncbi:MAG TPA: hypothetical protein VFM99_04995 [Chitinophagales bacterium]|nr:hypothetical protein [Chitinophagales bacterium]
MSIPKNVIINSLVFTFVLFSASSCQPILKAFVGVNNVKQYSANEILIKSNRYHLANENLYEIRDTAYWAFIKSYEGKMLNNYYTFKDLYQPLQVFSFDSTGILQFHLINCKVGGFPNLKWDRYGYFDIAPLKMPSTLLSDSTLKLNTIKEYYLPISINQDVSNTEFNECIIVYWNYFLGRQSKRLIKKIQEYNINTNSNAYVYYVNTDNLFYLMSQDTSDKVLNSN